MAAVPDLVVREMQSTDLGARINYFHDATDEQLHTMGVDRRLLPGKEAWRTRIEEDLARPIRDRTGFALVWELDGRMVGFSATDQIDFGKQAFMHLHILRPEERHAGLGAEFVKLSAAAFFRVLEIERLFCEPNALNVAPNRTLQRAGFRYLFSHETIPGPINFRQVTTRWVLERPE